MSATHELEEQIMPVDVAYLSIDSRRRDRCLFPDASNYVVDFDRVFKNVVSVELVYAVYPKFGDEDYVNLYIDELVPNMVSNCVQIGGSFTQLPLLRPKNEYTCDQYRSIKVFGSPLSKLAKFSIRFMGYDGNYYPIREHMLRFEIVTMKFNMKKNVILTRDTISVWIPPGLSFQDATNDVHTLNMQSQAMTEKESKRLLGISKDSKNIILSDVVDAFRNRSQKARRNGDQVNYLELKLAFKTLAKIYHTSTRPP